MTTDRRAIAAAAAVAAFIIAVGVGVVANDSPAESAAAGKVRPTLTVPGPPVPQPLDESRSGATKPVEKAPPVGELVTGDGTWIIGRDLKRGTYRTAGGSSCYWQRLRGQGNYRWWIVDSQYREGPQEVVLSKDDTAFASQGCQPWELVR